MEEKFFISIQITPFINMWMIIVYNLEKVS